MEIEARKVEYVRVHIDRGEVLKTILNDMARLSNNAPGLLQAIDTVMNYIDVLPED
jgi:hypothetical protein